MPALEGKKIILGITGSIAAYKSVILLRLLQKAGAEVQIILTEHAKEFVGELSFSSLSQSPVLSQLSQDQEWNNHVHLGLWADLFIIAPCTAQSLSKFAHGQVDNLLTAVYLSAKCPVLIAPAMDLDMWKHPATQSNIKIIESHHVMIAPVGEGSLASGLQGPGRLAEPSIIYELVANYFNSKKTLSGKKFLVTAGPTYEAIDPVRFIGNHSSGKMGMRIAEEAAKRGASVELVLGPTDEKLRYEHNIQVHNIQSADDMFEVVKKLFDKIDVFVFAAAVADFKPKDYADQKIKKTEKNLSLELVPTPDIAAFIGSLKLDYQRIIGFALETERLMEHAQLKLQKKNMDFVVINSANEKGAAFRSDDNKIQILHKDGKTLTFDLKSKELVAKDIIDELQTII